MRLILLATVLMLTACIGKKTAATKPYSVEKPKSNKHHAVIKILTENGGGCTAFVVSDKIAITAGHCIEISESLIKTNKQAAIMGAQIFIERTLSEMKSVDCNKIQSMPKIQCEAIKGRMNNDVAHAKRYIEKLNNNQPDSFRVLDSMDKEVNIKVTALDSELDYRDFGILKGDFSDFEKLPLARNFNIMPGEVLRTCGYANMKTPAVCSNFLALGNYEFYYRGSGYLVKGMSGGPVINSDGEVVGINVAVARDECLITPTIGILNIITD